MNMTEILYIDPGTGGMLFTILFGLFGVVVFSFRVLLMKMKFRASGGKSAKINGHKIPLAVFAENKRYWNIFGPLLDELEKRKQRTVYMTCSEDDPVFEKDYEYIESEFIGKGNKAFSRLNLLNASVVLSTTPSLDVFQWKRSKNVDYYIHIPHAPNDITLYRMFGIDHYDALILSGAYQEKEIRQLEEKRGLKAKEIELAGIPYMDEMKKKLETSGEVPAHERTVLLAPSWGESGILSKYGESIIDALIATGYKLIIRPHPQSFDVEKEMLEKLMTKYDESSGVEWNRDDNNFEVLRRSDILISDFSGVIFDFSLVFDKPVIFTKAKFDPAPYDAYWIEDPLWMFEILPSLGLELTDENIADIKGLIDRCIEDPSFGEGRDRARSETWVNIGQGAERAADFVIRKLGEVKAKRAEEEKIAQEAAKNKTGKFVLTKGKP
ncbi:MAG: CDP-glycerol glycerophosphotransferase family protein [Clostridiales bacterium]|nr:CDP-glycerol glycerophosphotransferase family protein [Clostridiales bacterium]